MERTQKQQYFSTQKQPAPNPFVPGEPPIADLLIEYLKGAAIPGMDVYEQNAALIQEFRARVEVGIRTYGTPLKAKNGRDVLVDAFQELCDTCVYLMQECRETELREDRELTLAETEDLRQAIALARRVHQRLLSRKTLP